MALPHGAACGSKVTLPGATHGSPSLAFLSPFLPDPQILCAHPAWCCRVLADLLDTLAVTTLAGLMFPQPFNEATCVYIAACIVVGLQQLHTQGVVYRALCADTLVVTADGRMQLVDLR